MLALRSAMQQLGILGASDASNAKLELQAAPRH